MSDSLKLNPDRLCWRCDPRQFLFETTDDLPDSAQIVGQARALDAVQFGIGIRRDGYNLYVLGPPGIGKRSLVQRFIQQRAEKEHPPPDWCYVHNFEHPHKPTTLRLPAGRGARLKQDMQTLLEDLSTAIPAALEVEEHQRRIEEIEDEAKQRHDKAFQALAEKALAQGVQLIRTPGGFALAPVRDGEVIGPEAFKKLAPGEQEQIEESIASLQVELQEIVEQVPQWRKQMRDKIKELNREVTRFVISHSLAQLREQYADLSDVLDYLEAIEKDVVENADAFRPHDDEPAAMLGLVSHDGPSLTRYQVNVLVDNADTKGAPVVYEDHPNHHNLLGGIEHRAQMGTLLTDFTLIKSGALHRASGGYLVVEALRILQQPYAWEGLKRALQAGRIKIESLAESLSLVSTVSLEPEPIPIDVKIVLLGERQLYYLLYQYDPDFGELFKVAADFDEEMHRTPETCQAYARLIGTQVRREKYKPFDRTAVARVIGHCARLADDSEKLTTHMRTVADLLREADYWAAQKSDNTVSAEHVDKAIDKQIYRVDRIRERVQEEIQRGSMLIDTQGSQVGQVNGLSVLDLGNFRFGRPSRITATARLGKGEVIDIEREVELGGAIHSKGVLILSSFLASRYAQEHPLSLSASLVFEQSYGMVDGDSASVAELCALLSVLADAQIKQSLAVTGSVNQHGIVQPIGGVNEKIEGFFDICRQRGLTGEQGVLIPAANVKHLMLRRDVVQAVAESRFCVYAVETVDQAVSLLTGLPAGDRTAAGPYPERTINGRVEARLLQLFRLRQKYGSEDDGGKPPQKESDDE